MYMTNNKIILEKKIKLLKSATDNKLTEETIKNLAKQIRKELLKDEEYEKCIIINTLEKKLLNRFKVNKKNLVKNVGLSKGELEKLLNMI